ncbi:MAG: GNAT family N-acetyltransferase [Pseudomonadota bacterium]
MSEAPYPIEDADLDWVLALNQAHVAETSDLTRASLSRMVEEAAYARCVDAPGAFLLVFDQTADYDSPNFLWFRERYDRFLYVDRIVVAATHRRRGLAKTLYEDLFDVARALGHAHVGCEVNSDPPNPGSDAFHEALGFEKVGEARLIGRGKSVRYLSKPL